MQIYLLRHGQTTGDIEDRYGGNYDDHLTDLGKKEAVRLSEELSKVGIEKVFSSPLNRAKETAEILKKSLGIDIEIIENLRERNHYGVLTGIIKSEAKEKFPEDVEKVKSYKTCATNGEEYLSFKERVENAFKEITKTDFSLVAVVTHGGVIREFFREVLRFGEIDLGDYAYALIEFYGGKYKLLQTVSISKKTIN